MRISAKRRGSIGAHSKKRLDLGALRDRKPQADRLARRRGRTSLCGPVDELVRRAIHSCAPGSIRGTRTASCVFCKVAEASTMSACDTIRYWRRSSTPLSRRRGGPFIWQHRSRVSLRLSVAKRSQVQPFLLNAAPIDPAASQEIRIHVHRERHEVLGKGENRPLRLHRS